MSWGDVSRRYLRGYLPDRGESYELFDLAATFWVAVVASYAIAAPSPATSAALQWLVGPTPLEVWSILLNAAALVALICAWAPAAVRVGRGLIFTAASTWSTVLLIGWVVDYDATPELLLEGVRMGGWWALATFLITVTVQGGTGNKTWPRAIRAGVVAAAWVGGAMLILCWSGDPRPFTSAVFYGFLARTAHHQTYDACLVVRA